MISKFNTAANLYTHLGPRWMAYRFKYALQQRIGTMPRRFPASSWESQPLAGFLKANNSAEPQAYFEQRIKNLPPFFFLPEDFANSADILTQWDTNGKSSVLVANRIASGQLCYFEHIWAEVGMPPQWFHNPFTDVDAPHSLHWSDIPDFGYGDIKIIWEPSRFGFVYTLVRAYWRTGNESYAELFWSLIENWREHNPPQLGPNWKCGQETSFRVMAWCFGLYGFWQSSASTPQRVASLAQMIAISGYRIEGNLGYALSQRNNHGISEGVGLWTIGLLFPELRDAERWRITGKNVLERLAQELIYNEGAFSQNSVNYHRVMLHDYVWAIQLGELHECPLSNELKERVIRSAYFLYQLQDDVSGSVPLYGHNDGALILPLSNCDYADFRPVINAALYSQSQVRTYELGPWDEDLFWLYGSDAINEPVQKPERSSFSAEPSGYYTLRSPNGFVFTRCGQYKDRPAHADALHVDIWWNGRNIACDPGTYSYNAPEPWDYQLARSIYHNSVTVDDCDQMEKRSKFLWLPWLSGKTTAANKGKNGNFDYWEGEHNGYKRLPYPVNHRRGIISLPNEHWLIIDRLTSTASHDYRLHWLLMDAKYKEERSTQAIHLMTEDGPYFAQFHTSATENEAMIVRCSPNSPTGWRAPYYHSREPALAWQLSAKSDSIWFWTLFGPDNSSLSIENFQVEISASQWQAVLMLLPQKEHDDATPLLGDVVIETKP